MATSGFGAGFYGRGPFGGELLADDPDRRITIPDDPRETTVPHDNRTVVIR